MFGKVLEWAAARHEPRFRLFREGKLAYEAYIQSLGVPFHNLTDQDYQKAKADPRLQYAEKCYREALNLTRLADAPNDAATALSQLGMLLHLVHDWDKARDCFVEAIQILDEAAQAGTTERGTLSCCHYHLGLLNLKESRFSAARDRLERSIAIDEDLNDVGGVKLGRLALDDCPLAGIDSGPEPESKPRPEAPVPLSEAKDGAADTGTPLQDEEAIDSPGIFSASTREALWILAYSDNSIAEIQRIATEACPRNRELLLVTAAFESGAPDPPVMAPRTTLCGAVLVINRQALTTSDFRYWAAWCLQRVHQEPDFRLFIHLENMTESAFVSLALSDPLVAELRDNIHMNQPESLEHLRHDLRNHFLHLELIRDRTKWRTARRVGLVMVGGLSSTILGSVIIAWLFVSGAALIGGKASVVAWATSLSIKPDWIGVLGGVPLFWGNLMPLTFILQGVQVGNQMLKNRPKTGRWLVWGLIVVNASIWLPLEIHASTWAISAGAAWGVLLEATRRSKASVNRRRLLSWGQRIAAGTEVPDSLVFPGRQDPISWPLFSPRPKVFISYSRSSKWGENCAAALHQRIKKVGSDSFLDRQSIPPGASWQQELDEQVGEAIVFVGLCDQHSVQRPWVAAELAAALVGRHHSGIPEILLLREPSLTSQQLNTANPVFRDLLLPSDAEKEGAPRIVTVRDGGSIFNVGSTLAPSRFTKAAVFPEGLRLGLLTLGAPLVFLTTLLPILGVPSFFVGIAVQWGKVDLGGWFENSTIWWLGILTSYALGATIRQAIGARYEGFAGQRGRAVFATMRFSVIGFALLLPHLLQRMDFLGVVWSGAALWFGWIVTVAFLGGVLQGKRFDQKK